MVSLELLGGVSLEVDGRAVRGPPAQRHRLALLSVLAVSTSRTPTRDKLIALLWPERDDKSARKLLNQSVYVLRKAFGEQVIRSVADELRLDTSSIYCDVTAFERAAAAGELPRAAALYGGPFLDGFFLGGSPSFERWVDAERRRLSDAHATVLEELAMRADARRHVRRAVEWWKARAAHDPFDSRVALRLMEALEAAGNFAGALETAGAHARLLKQELGMDPPPEIDAAVERLRRVPGHIVRREEEGSAQVSDHSLSIRLTGARSTRPSSPTEPLRKRSTAQWITYGLATALVATVALGIWRLRVGRPGNDTMPRNELVSASPDESTRIDPTTTLAARGTESVAAYELYLHGSDPLVLRSDSAARRGLEDLRQAVAYDPNYSAAWAALACLYLRVGNSDGADAGLGEREALAEQAALRAVALDGSLADSHASLGLVRMTHFDFDAAEKELMRAIALRPDDTRAREWLVAVYLWTGRLQEALTEANRATELDPLSPTANAELARALAANDRCDEALTVLHGLQGLEPQLLRVRVIAAGCYAQRGSWQRATELLRTQVEHNRNANSLGMLGHMLARAGRREEALYIRAELMDRWRDSRSGALPVATVYAGLGDADRAFTWLERAVDDHSLVVSSHNYQVMTTISQVLGNDSRFEGLSTRLGLKRANAGSPSD